MMSARTVSAMVFGLLAVLLCCVCPAAPAAPALTRADIEADWARQAEVRRPHAAPTPRLDAAGGCDGGFAVRYLPQGDIVFVSTRKGVALQAGLDSASATYNAAMPDSYSFLSSKVCGA